MNLRNMALWVALGAVTALPAAAAPAMSAPAGLPACPAGPASTRAPSTPAGPDSPGACRAAGRIVESAVRLTRPEETDFTPSGYHHLGANSAGAWGGVSGRISVVDGSIRPGSYDFVAARFMVKRDMGSGNKNMAFLRDDQGMVLSMFKGKDVKYPGTFHIGFIQPSEQKVDEINARLRADGFAVDLPQRTHGWTFYVKAPGGFTVEVLS